MKKTKLKKNKRPRLVWGFTLMEAVVAASLFVTVITIGGTAVLNMQKKAEQVRAVRNVLDNMNFVMEDMKRNIRLGTFEGFVGDDKDSSGVIFRQFDATDIGDSIIYAIDFSSNQLIKEETKGGVVSNGILTPKEIVIDSNKSSFSVSGSDPTDNEQPSVFIKLFGTISIPEREIETDFNLQTTVTMRKLDSEE